MKIYFNFYFYEEFKVTLSKFEFIVRMFIRTLKFFNKNIETVYYNSKFKIFCVFDNRPHCWKSKQFAQKF